MAEIVRIVCGGDIEDNQLHGPHTQTNLQYCISTTCNFTPTGALHFCQSIC